MVTRAATSGKWKFVLLPGTFVPCGKLMAVNNNSGNTDISYTPCKELQTAETPVGHGFCAAGIHAYFFRVVAKNSTVRFHASAASAAR
jgi:hypothetical protein